MIVGGGPAGCATALTLAGAGITDVLVVEGEAYQSVRVGESIPPDTRLLLEKLGVWKDFLEEGHDVCYGSASSWGDDALGYNDFLFNPFGNGWHLDRRQFNQFLSRKVVEAGAGLLTQTRFEGATAKGEEGFSLTLQEAGGSKRTVDADVVVDATGHLGVVAKSMGSERMLHDRLICVYGFFTLTEASKLSRLTMLEAVENGWWYAARLPGGEVAAAFAGDPETVKAEGLTTPDKWRAALRGTRYIADALEGCRFIEANLKAWPALSFILDHPAGNRWLAVGDAASSYDPISSQGIHKALADGIKGGEALAQYMAGRQDALNDYAESLRVRFRNYLANRNYFYDMEQRWPDSTFWARRKARRGIAEVYVADNSEREERERVLTGK